MNAAQTLLDQLSPEQKETITYHIDAPEWRTWSNPEFLLSHKGIRLEEVDPHVRDSVLVILQRSCSPEGECVLIDPRGTRICDTDGVFPLQATQRRWAP